MTIFAPQLVADHGVSLLKEQSGSGNKVSCDKESLRLINFTDFNNVIFTQKNLEGNILANPPNFLFKLLHYIVWSN